MLNRFISFVSIVAVGLTFTPSTSEAQDLYAGQYSLGKVYKIALDQTKTIFLNSTSTNRIDGMTFDGEGNLYIAGGYLSNFVRKFDPTGTDLGIFVTNGLSWPGFPQFDNSGNLYVTSWNNSSIRRFRTVQGDAGTFFATVSGPEGMTLDADQNVYVSSYNDAKVYRFTPTGQPFGISGQSPGVFASVSLPSGVVFDNVGNLYVASLSNNAVYRFTPAGLPYAAPGKPLGVFANTGLSTPSGMAFDLTGNLYVANIGNGTVRRFASDGTDTGNFATDLGDVWTLAFRIVPTGTPVIVGGTVVLQSTFNAAQTIAFTFRPQPSGNTFTRITTLSANGTYSFPDIPANKYTLSIKGAKWLRKNLTIDARLGNIANANATLRAGDANNDNFVDIADLLLLIGHYNQTFPAAGYLNAADFNDDGINDITDLLLLVGNFNEPGDP